MKYLLAALLTGGVLFAGFGLDRTVGLELILAFGPAFVGYGLLFMLGQAFRERQFVFLLAAGAILRLVLVFAFPTLSDDVYRFIWDGQLIQAGINPFAQLPAYYLDPANQVAGLTPELFGLLNSPEYYTIYPPVAQGVFSLAVWLSPDSWYGAALVMKLFLLACEFGTAWLLLRILTHYRLPRSRLLFYWLNPLILIEIMGNLHFEGAMVVFLLLALWALLSKRWVVAAAGMALSVASKLLPLMLLPFLVKRLYAWRQNLSTFLWFSGAFGAFMLLLFLPLLFAGFPENFGNSLDLYFRRFEFNASIYYLARAYGYWEIGWNQIERFGPLLAKIAAVGILLFALLERGFKTSRWSDSSAWRALPGVWLWAFVLYLFCATTVHPWYLSVPIALTVLSRWRFPLFWSAMICLTYATYLTDPYRELLGLVALEYGLVIVFLGYELYRWRAKQSLKTL